MIKLKKIRLLIIIGIMLAIITASILIKINKPKTLTTSVPPVKYEILIDVEESKLYLFEDNKMIKTYKCSGGKWSTPSPIGTWRIVSKAKWGEGFGRKLDGAKCSMGTIWNTWHTT